MAMVSDPPEGFGIELSYLMGQPPVSSEVTWYTQPSEAGISPAGDDPVKSGRTKIKWLVCALFPISSRCSALESGTMVCPCPQANLTPAKLKTTNKPAILPLRWCTFPPIADPFQWSELLRLRGVLSQELQRAVNKIAAIS